MATKRTTTTAPPSALAHDDFTSLRRYRVSGESLDMGGDWLHKLTDAEAAANGARNLTFSRRDTKKLSYDLSLTPTQAASKRQSGYVVTLLGDVTATAPPASGATTTTDAPPAG